MMLESLTRLNQLCRPQASYNGPKACALLETFFGVNGAVIALPFEPCPTLVGFAARAKSNATLCSCLPTVLMYFVSNDWTCCYRLTPPRTEFLFRSVHRAQTVLGALVYHQLGVLQLAPGSSSPSST